MRTGRPPERTGCAVDGCERKHYGRGYCRPHYYRWTRTGSVGTRPIVTRMPTGGPCAVDGCERSARTQGMCNAHYLRTRANGEPGPPSVRRKNAHGAGGRWMDRNGYVILSNGRRRQAEHRWVMEKLLSRPLLPGESVHHINGVRDDNREENLELWVSSHPTGQRVEDVLAWAREIVARYS